MPIVFTPRLQQVFDETGIESPWDPKYVSEGCDCIGTRPQLRTLARLAILREGGIT